MDFRTLLSESDSTSKKRYLPAAFCMESSLHGLRFIGQPKRHIVERVFWIISFSVAVIVAIVFITQIWDKYRKTPVITVFHPKEMTIDAIPFPAVTVCNTNNVIKSKAEAFVRRVKSDPTNEEANNDLFLLDHVCQTSTTFSETFNFSLEYGAIHSEMREQFTELRKNKTNKSSPGRKITDLLQDVAQKCSNMILLCMWHDDVYNCSDLFDEVETDFGYCCVFNMIPQSLLLKLRNDSRDREFKVKEWESLDLDTDNLILKDEESDSTDANFENAKCKPPPKFPYRQNRAGKTTGLSVLLDPDLESYFCTNTDSAGFMALAHIPLDFPRVADKGIAIKPNSETYIKIRPEVIIAEDDIKGFALEKRNCYFGKEYALKYYNYYTTSNCENECIANITMNECGCVRYFMPRDEKQAICGANKFNCSERVRKRLLQEGLKRRCRVCLPSCTEIEYHMTSSYMPLRLDIPLWEHPNGTNASWTHKSVSILHVHFSVDSTYPKLRKELYGFIDLISNTGGLLGLCLGFSVLSLLEILYFMTLRLYCQTRRGKIMGHKVTTVTSKLWGKAFEAITYIGKPPLTSKSKMSYPTNVEEYGERVLRNVLKNTKLPVAKYNCSGAKELKLDSLPYYVENRENSMNW